MVNPQNHHVFGGTNGRQPPLQMSNLCLKKKKLHRGSHYKSYNGSELIIHGPCKGEFPVLAHVVTHGGPIFKVALNTALGKEIEWILLRCISSDGCIELQGWIEVGIST